MNREYPLLAVFPEFRQDGARGGRRPLPPPTASYLRRCLRRISSRIPRPLRKGSRSRARKEQTVVAKVGSTIQAHMVAERRP